MTSRNGSKAVAVIGAGLAGLTAARKLTEAGHGVVALEARHRVGGRAFTVRDGFQHGQHADFGGELVTAHYRELPSLCEEFSVELSKPSHVARADVLPSETRMEAYLAEGKMLIDGEPLVGVRFKTVDLEIRKALEATPPQPQELIVQWFLRAGLSRDARQALTGLGRFFQYDLHQIEASAFLTETHVEPARRVVGGTQRLAEALADGLDIRLAAEVTIVRQTDDGVQLDLATGERFEAAHAVVAVPGYVAPTIAFDPPLSAMRTSAVLSLQRATGGKVVAQYVEGDAIRAAINQNVYTDGPINTVWVGNPYVTEGPAVVAGLVCADGTKIFDEQGRAIRELDAIVDAVVGKQVRRLAHVEHDWASDPYARGVVAIPNYAARESFSAILASPEGRVHFAGDYTDPVFPGTLEGAVCSGLRAAADIASALAQN
jgi:monoamine oxidase